MFLDNKKEMLPICKEIRKDILRISNLSAHGHIPTCFSVIEILYVIYKSIKHDPQNPSWEERDIFILSKGHASLAHYCILAKFGYFDTDKLDSFGAFMSDFGCHADRLKVPGVEVSTGSLGHGIGIAVGIALAFKIQKKDRRVFVLIGDGEANEGSVWEAVMVAVNIGLNNLTIIYDNNMSEVRGLQIYNPEERFTAFGCDSVGIDGQDVDSLKAEIAKRSDRVRTIVAHTKKGFGCKTLVECHHEWHRKSPNDAELKQFIEEIDA